MPKNNLISVMFAFIALVFFWLLGLSLSQFVALPPALLGLLLLFVGLLLLGRVPKALEQVGQFCLRHLSLFFIPPLVAAWFYTEQMADKLWLFLVAIIFSTFVSLCLTAWLAQRFLNKPDLADSSTNKSKEV